MSENQLKEIFKPSRIYPIVIIGLMYGWWKFYLEPLKDTRTRMYYAEEGYFKTKDKEDVFSAIFSEDKHSVKGKTMGVIGYSIHYFDEKDRNMKPQIDSVLQLFNNTFSTYVPTSLISKFNNGNEVNASYWIKDLHDRTLKIYTNTDGLFDPTVKPLVSFWGFGGEPNQNQLKDSTQIDSLLNLVGYNHVVLSDGSLIKKEKGVQLDYGAVAKGYGVDVVADLLEKNGIESYMVEIGGEIKVGQPKPSGEDWTLAIEDVNTYERGGKIYLKLKNQAIATSGNYRNFRIDSISGERYQHTIHPKIGYPVKNTLLSVSVITDYCLEADAYATALMVMGVEEAKKIAELNQLDVCLMYSNKENIEIYQSEGFKNRVLTK